MIVYECSGHLGPLPQKVGGRTTRENDGGKLFGKKFSPKPPFQKLFEKKSLESVVTAAKIFLSFWKFLKTFLKKGFYAGCGAEPRKKGTL
jgi:hypothetical protein